MKEQERFRYDLGFSFAGDSRPFVRSVAYLLGEDKVKMFFDEFQESELWGADLLEELPIHYLSCRYVVLVMTEDYLEKPWTVYERREILFEFLRRRDSRYILPIRYNGFSKNVPGLSPSMHM